MSQKPSISQTNSFNEVTTSDSELLKSGQYIKIGDASKRIRVSIDTLRRWEKSGKLTPYKTSGGTRLYSVNQLTELKTKKVDDLSSEIEMPKSEIEEMKLYDEPVTHSHQFIYPASSDPPQPLSTKELLEEKQAVGTSPEVPSPFLNTYREDDFFAPENPQQTIEKTIKTNRLPLTATLVLANLMLFIVVTLFLSSYTNHQLLTGIFSAFGSSKNRIAVLPESTSDVLAASSIANQGKYLEINADTVMRGDLAVDGTGTFIGNLTAPNIIYSITAGSGINVTAGQTPTISSSDTLALVTGRGATTTTPVTFSGGATIGGSLNLGQLSTDPANAQNGATYYNTTSNAFKCYINQSWKLCDTSNAAFSGITLAGTSGTSQTISDGDTLTIAADSGLTTTAESSDKVTVGLDVVVSTDSTTTTPTTNNSGLEITTTGLSLLRSCSSGQVLSWNTSGYWECSSAGGTSASGTTGTIAKFTGGSSLGDSLISESGTTLSFGTTATLTASSLATISASSALAINGPAAITTNQTTLALFNDTAINISFAGAATTLNIGPTGSGASSVVLSGGSADTGCTLNGATGDLACTGNITGATTGTAGYWSRSGGTLTPATDTDSITTKGNISTTVGGTLSIAGAATFSSTINTNNFTSTALTFAGTTPVISASTASTSIDLQPGSGGAVLLSGGSGSTGCTVDASGNFTCTGSISSSGGSDTGFWSRDDGTDTLTPVTTGDNILTSGNITTSGTGQINSAGLLTGQTGLTVTGGVVSLNASSNNNTNINTGNSTGTIGIGNSAAGALTIASGATSTVTITNGALTLSTTGASGGAINLTSSLASGNTVASAFNIKTSTDLGSNDEVFQVGDSGADFLTILGSGNVGIGDTSPAALLTVGSGDLFQVDSSGNITNIGGAAHTIANSTGALNIDAATSGALNLNGTGTGDVNIAGGSVSNGCTVANSSGNLTCTGSITGATSGTAGYWSRSSTTLSPATANDIVSIANTTTTGADLAITNTGIYTGTGIVNLTANSATSGTVASISATGLNTGNALTITGGTSLTTGGLLNITGASYNHTGAETGTVSKISFTDASSNSAGNSSTTGFNITPTFNSTASGGSSTLVGASSTLAFTACSSGATCSSLGFFSTTPVISFSGTNTLNLFAFGSSGNGALTNSSSGTINWRGTSITTPNVTQTSGTISSIAYSAILGTATTGGTQTGLSVVLPSTTSSSTTFKGISLTSASSTSNGTDTGIDFAGTTWDNSINAATNLSIGINGTTEVLLDDTTLSPNANDGNALGTATLSWSDLFLASGGVINWNNGDVTLTHSAGTLTLAGATTLSAASVTTFNCTDCINFDDLADSMTLDANQTITQGTNTWSQTFTGDTTVGLTYIANSLTTGTGVLLTSSGTITSGGEVLNVTGNSVTTGNLLDLSATGLNTGQGINLTLGTALTTGGGLNITGASYNHTGTESGALASIAFTDASSQSSGNPSTIGLSIAPTINNTSSGGTDTIIGVNTSIPASGITCASGGNCQLLGFRAFTPAYTHSTNSTFNVNGFSSTGNGALVSNSASAIITWVGANITTPNITQTNGTITGTGYKATLGTATTGGTQTGLNITPPATTNSSTTTKGISISSIGTASNGTDTAIDIGTLWDIDLNATTSLELGIDGSGEVNLNGTSLAPNTNDGNALGTATLSWGDLFLASGGVINWNNGDVTITHATDSLSVAGGDFNIDVIDGQTINFDGDGSPTADLVKIGNGDTTTTDGTDALVLNLTSSNASADLLHLTPSVSVNASDTYNLIEADAFTATISASGTLTLNGLKFGNLTESETTGTVASTAINIGTGWDTALGLANAATIDFASGATGNTQIWKLPSLTSGGCTNGNAEGVIIKDSGGTQQGHICIASSGGLKFFATAFNTNNTDVAENYSDSSDSLEAGDVVTIDQDTNNGVVKTTDQYDQNTLGIISTAPGISLTGISEDGGKTDLIHPKPVALTGRVPTKVSSENGSIEPGDYLTSSSTPGVAMKATRPGQVVGKALQEFDAQSGTTGKIMAFINITYADPGNVLANLILDDQGNLVIPKIKTASITLDPQAVNINTSFNINDRNSINYTPNYLETAARLDTIDSKVATQSAAIAGVQTEVQNQKSALDSLKDSIASISTKLTNSASPSADLTSNPQPPTSNPDLTPPDLLLATGSANLANLKVSETLSSDKLLTALDATVSGTFKALSDVFLGSTTISGDLDVDGTFSISQDSINVVGLPDNNTGILYLQKSDLAQGLDIFNGKVTVDKTGKLTAQTISSKTVSAVEYRVEPGTTTGSAVIPSGKSEVAVFNNRITDKSKIFVTTTSNTNQTISVVTKIAGKGFVVSTTQPSEQNIKFDYWIITESELD